MKNALITLFILALFAVAPTVALANESEAEQSQEVEVECTTSGSYGQETNCKARGEQNQKVVIRDGKVLGAHTPVDTGNELTAFGLPLLLMGGLIALRKVRG